MSAQTGAPLSIACQNVMAASGRHSTRSEEVLPEVSQLDGLSDTIRFVDRCELGEALVHIADRECDSVGHFRQWQSDQRLFVVRARYHRIVKHDGQDKSLHAIVTALGEQQAFHYCGEVQYKGKRAYQYVAETPVRLDRPAKPKRTKHGPSPRRVPGEAIDLRLVVSRIENTEGELVAEWLLWSNVPGEDMPHGVTAARLAQWYYWRWRIESFFKLMKSAGHNVEHWQQETAVAIAKRLLVATMACVVIWQLARRQEPEAGALREVLIRLSGRQMKWGTAFTAPALLAGVGVLMAMLDVLEHFEVAEIVKLTRRFLPGHDGMIL